MEIIEMENPDGTKAKHVIIDRGNGEFTSMLKSTYDEMKKNEAASKSVSPDA